MIENYQKYAEDLSKSCANCANIRHESSAKSHKHKCYKCALNNEKIKDTGTCPNFEFYLMEEWKNR